MISESTVRQWYTPVEVSTLQRWLLVSFVVNIVLLAVDLLRGTQSNAVSYTHLTLPTKRIV